MKKMLMSWECFGPQSFTILLLIYVNTLLFLISVCVIGETLLSRMYINLKTTIQDLFYSFESFNLFILGLKVLQLSGGQKKNAQNSKRWSGHKKEARSFTDAMNRVLKFFFTSPQLHRTKVTPSGIVYNEKSPGKQHL